MFRTAHRTLLRVQLYRRDRRGAILLAFRSALLYVWWTEIHLKEVSYYTAALTAHCNR